MHRAASLIVGFALMVGCVSVAWAAGPLAAEAGTLSRELLARDKRDKLGGATVERGLCRAWLGQANEAIKEGEERRARFLLVRTRAAMGLLDALIMLSQVEHERRHLTALLKKLRASAAEQQQRVDERSEHIKVLRKVK